MRFENLDVWKRAVKLSATIYNELRCLKDYGFKDQITRSGLSIPSNIAEGFERLSSKESVVFYLMPRDHAVNYGRKFISEWKYSI